MDISRPTVIPVYNKAMGGTDKFDQFGSYYDDRKRSIKWHRRIIIHFFRASVINVHILHNSNNLPKARKLTLLQAIQSIVTSWAGQQQEDAHLDQDEDDEEAEAFSRLPELKGTGPPRLFGAYSGLLSCKANTTLRSPV